MKYIIDVPEEIAKISEKFLSRAGLLCEPYTEPDRKAIEDEVWRFLVFLIDEMDVDDKYNCFNQFSAYKIASTMSYQEAKAKYEAWKKQRDRLRVGDEVLNHLGKSYVIYEIKNNSAYGIMFDEYPLSQECFSIYDSNKKTGRHFDEVTELLKKMRGNEEE